MHRAGPLRGSIRAAQPLAVVRHESRPRRIQMRTTTLSRHLAFSFIAENQTSEYEGRKTNVGAQTHLLESTNNSGANSFKLRRQASHSCPVLGDS